MEQNEMKCNRNRIESDRINKMGGPLKLSGTKGFGLEILWYKDSIHKIFGCFSIRSGSGFCYAYIATFYTQ